MEEDRGGKKPGAGEGDEHRRRRSRAPDPPVGLPGSMPDDPRGELTTITDRTWWDLRVQIIEVVLEIVIIEVDDVPLFGLRLVRRRGMRGHRQDALHRAGPIAVGPRWCRLFVP